MRTKYLRTKYLSTSLLLLALTFNVTNASIYYVSNSSGNDKLDGQSEAGAWKTISKVNSVKLRPGDSVMFRRGDVWRETLVVSSSGTQGDWIVYSAYGSGNSPKILGSEKAANWIDKGRGIWQATDALSDPFSAGRYGSEIFFENNDGTVSWGVHKKSASECLQQYDWTYEGGKISVFSATDPSKLYRSVEVPQRKNSIMLNNKDFLRISNLDLFYLTEAAMAYRPHMLVQQKGLIVENCRIAYISVKDSELGYGIDAAYSDMIVRGCEIHNCGRRGISFHLYGSINLKNVLIENNIFHDGFHTTGPDFSVGSTSRYISRINGVIIRRNLFYDPPATSANTNHIFLQNYRHDPGDASIDNIFIYSNIFIAPSEGAIQMEGTQGVFIYNNTFYEHNSTRAETIGHVWVDNNNSKVIVKNNIFYSSLASDENGCGVELFIRAGQDPSKIVADHNLYYRINNHLRIIEKESTDTYYMDGLENVRKAMGWELNSPVPADPLFESPGTRNFRLKPGSPAIGKGVFLNLPFDFYGNPYNPVLPSLGACEFNQAKSFIPSKK